MRVLRVVAEPPRCAHVHDAYDARCALPAGHHGAHEAATDPAGHLVIYWTAFGRTA